MAKGLTLVAAASRGFELVELPTGDGNDLVVIADEDSIEACTDKLRGAGVDVHAVRVDLPNAEDVHRLHRAATTGGRVFAAAALNTGSGRGDHSSTVTWMATPASSI
jgi:uncharacterized protein